MRRNNFIISFFFVSLKSNFYKFLFENGYSQVQLIGSTGTMWVKTNAKGKLIDVEGKEVEVK